MSTHDSFEYRSLFEYLEERVLFDGVPDATFLIPSANAQSDVPAQVQFESTEFSAPRELILIDAGVEDGDQLLAGILESKSESALEIRFLDGNSSGIDQISEILSSADYKYDAIHILFHGSEGSVALGDTTLSLDNLADHADSLSSWSNYLTDDADLLFYGCDLAGNEAGESFIETISTITGADVAASDDLTGAAELGGDWDLELNVGTVETAALSTANWDGTLNKTVVNAEGGQAADGSDGLQLHVIDNGQIQIGFRLQGSANGNYQTYEPGTDTESALLFQGVYLAVGDQVTGSAQGADGATRDAVWGELGQTITGSGSQDDPYIVKTTLFTATDGTEGYNAATDVLVEIETIYTFPNAYFTERVTVTPPEDNTEFIKYYHVIDTFLSGGDNGPAFSLPQDLAQNNDTTGNASLVGVRKDPGGPNDSFLGFAEAQGSVEFSHWYSANWQSSQVAGGGIIGGSDIANTWNTNPGTDNEIAIQIDLGVATAPQTFEYHVAFAGEATIDLDADDSSGVEGTGYQTTYEIGSTEPISIADTDASIRNVVGDIQELRVSIADAVTGDTLTVNTSALPSGVQIQSQTATEVILEAVSTPQTEETFDAALAAVGFTTTSTIESTRSFDIGVTNELGLEGAASSVALTIGFDTDGDGVLDPNDLDDDNDGILDIDEGLGESAGQFSHQNFKEFRADAIFGFATANAFNGEIVVVDGNDSDNDREVDLEVGDVVVYSMNDGEDLIAVTVVDIADGAQINAETTRPGESPKICLLYTSPSPRDATLSRMPSSA